MDDSISFGAWVKQQRKVHDLTQDLLAEQVGCSGEMIRKIEAGTARPSRPMAALIVAQLGIPAAEIPAFVDWARGGYPPIPSAPPSPATTASDGEISPTFQTAPHSNLPFYPTSLVGRAAEIAALRGLLCRDDVRLVTLTGPPGVGKTRLALESAAGLRETYPGGVWFVPLAPIREAALVAPAIAHVLQIPESRGESPVETLAGYLRDKHVLLLLDNFEQVLAAGSLVATLLTTTARLKVLVTSRTLLNLYGEYEFPLPPMRVPDPAGPLNGMGLDRYEAVELWRQRAEAANPSSTLTPTVGEICRRLDGLPLAIELAAAQCKHLPPEILLARLDQHLPLMTAGPRDLPARHQTLRAAITWSYDLLAAEDQRLLRRLACFAGGWSLEAAQAICADSDGEKAAIPSRLENLVAASLVVCRPQDAEVRYNLLETIREFAGDRLGAAGERARAGDRHLQYYAQWIAEVEPGLFGSQATETVAAITREYDNLRTAVEWAAGEGDRAQGLKLVGALWRYCDWAGFESVVRDWVRPLLPAAHAGPPSRERARALHTFGRLAWRCGDLAEARGCYDEALAIFRALDDPAGTGLVLTELGIVAMDEGLDPAESYRLLTGGLATRRAAGDEWGIAHSLYNLGCYFFMNEDYPAARAAFEEALAIHQARRNGLEAAWVFMIMGDVHLCDGSYARAVQHVEDALALFREAGNKRGIANAQLLRASLACEHGDYDQARALFEECLAGAENTLDRRDRPPTLLSLGQIAMRQHDFARARDVLAEALALYRARDNSHGIVWAMGEHARLAQATGDRERESRMWHETLAFAHEKELGEWIVWGLRGLAGVALQRDQIERGARLHAAAQALLPRVRQPGATLYGPSWMLTPQSADEAAAITRARAQIDPAAWEASWIEGQAMSTDQAIAYALEEPTPPE